MYVCAYAHFLIMLFLPYAHTYAHSLSPPLFFSALSFSPIFVVHSHAGWKMSAMVMPPMSRWSHTVHTIICLSLTFTQWNTMVVRTSTKKFHMEDSQTERERERVEVMFTCWRLQEKWNAYTQNGKGRNETISSYRIEKHLKKVEPTHIRTQPLLRLPSGFQYSMLNKLDHKNKTPWKI